MLVYIDPGNIDSAFVIVDLSTFKPVLFGKVENEKLLSDIPSFIADYKIEYVGIEMIANLGLSVGKSVFDTVFWIGRFWEKINYFKPIQIKDMQLIYRHEEKMHICHSMRAKDGNIRQALIDRFGEVGVKAKPGFFYGFKADIWAAYAVCLTYIETKVNTVV
jgi:hypothetical protein